MKENQNVEMGKPGPMGGPALSIVSEKGSDGIMRSQVAVTGLTHGQVIGILEQIKHSMIHKQIDDENAARAKKSKGLFGKKKLQ